MNQWIHGTKGLTDDGKRWGKFKWIFNFNIVSLDCWLGEIDIDVNVDENLSFLKTYLCIF